MMEGLPYRATGNFKPLFLDYVEGNLKSELFAHAPVLASFEHAINAKSGFPESHRSSLVSAMLKQHERWNLNKASLIQALSNRETYTVTTGHQLSIFGGPLFVLNKILTAIKISEELKKKHSDKRFIPVFWLASEDHDYEEIRSLNLFGQDIRLSAEISGAVGRANVDQFAAEVKQLLTILDNDANGSELAEIVREAYKRGTLADATAKFWYKVLSKYNFLIIDGDDPSLKGLFADQMKQELSEGKIQKATAAREADLQNLGYGVQAPASKVNLFKLEGGARIKVQEIGEVDAAVSPEVLSPNVMMRPLYQESILPNLAYVGGPGETAYWAQLQPAFEAFNIPMPVVWPRATIVTLSEKHKAVMAEYHISVDMLVEDVNAVIKEKVVMSDAQIPPLEEFTDQYLNQLRETIKDYPDLEQQLEAVGARLHKDADKLVKSIERKIKHEHEKPVKDIQRLYSNVASGLQDRKMSSIECVLKNGVGVVDKIYNGISLNVGNVIFVET